MKKFKLKELLEMQDTLDQVIFKKSKVENREEVIEKIKLALMVELSELANEWQGFKYWKSNKKINREKMLEEWSDCLHFALSLDLYYIKRDGEKKDYIRFGNQCFIEFEVMYKTDFSEDIEEVTLSLLLSINENITRRDFAGITFGIFQIGYSLGFTLEEMVQAYKTKRNINFKRVSEGY